MKETAREYYIDGWRHGFEDRSAEVDRKAPAVDGPARAEVRRILEAHQPDDPPMRMAELRAKVEANLPTPISDNSAERLWKLAREEYPEKTKGPGRPKNTAPISK